MDAESESSPGSQQVERKGFWNGLGSSLQTQSATWFVGTVIAVLSIFSSSLTERLKFSLNKVDLRTKSYEALAADFSEYVFISSQYEEYLQKNLTTEKDLTPIVNEYNDAITKLNRNEFIYRSWIARYWDKKQVNQFAETMTAVRTLDGDVHSSNEEAELVVAHTKPRFDADKANQAAGRMKPDLERVRSQVSAMLEGLD